MTNVIWIEDTLKNAKALAHEFNNRKNSDAVHKWIWIMGQYDILHEGGEVVTEQIETMKADWEILQSIKPDNPVAKMMRNTTRSLRRLRIKSSLP